MFLKELNQSITTLKGIGERTAEAYAKLGIRTWSDLLTHLPRSYEDRTVTRPFAKGYDGSPVLTVMDVVAHEQIRYRKGFALKVIVKDDTGPAALLCYGRNFLKSTLEVGRRLYFYGQGKLQYGELQFSAFETAPWEEGVPPPAEFSRILPVYPLTEGLTQRRLRRDIAALLRSSARHLSEELPQDIRSRHDLMGITQAVKRIHFPPDLKAIERARHTLVFGEFFYLNLLIRRRALKRKEERRKTVTYPRGLYERLKHALPFPLTEGQQRTLGEILEDLEGDTPAARLIQGDVGSGKTLTALLSAVVLIEAGRQAAFMVPTELLARQHAEEAARLLEPLGINTALLHGGLKPSERKLLVKALSSGDIDLLIGTHALFSRDVSFRDLGLVIIDEQHRFGVLQRVALSRKGSTPDMLYMTATPIPRTLTMTVFGDLDVSTIDTMPPGRKPVITHLASEQSRMRVYQAVRRELERGRQAYFVYPRIGQGVEEALKDATSMYRYLTEEVYPGMPAGLVHSKVPQDEQERTMAAFKKGSILYLVATSVVEVGVHVPHATCMVIEHAERFGLSALHQLRGRVGRGSDQAYAFFIYSRELTDQGKQRLKVMKETTDGFRIAEEDLKIRGPGDISGTRQSGFIQLTFGDLVRDLKVLHTTRKEADRIIDEDPGLLSPSYSICREVLERSADFTEELFDG